MESLRQRSQRNKTRITTLDQWSKRRLKVSHKLRQVNSLEVRKFIQVSFQQRQVLKWRVDNLLHLVLEGSTCLIKQSPKAMHMTMTLISSRRKRPIGIEDTTFKKLSRFTIGTKVRSPSREAEERVQETVNLERSSISIKVLSLFKRETPIHTKREWSQSSQDKERDKTFLTLLRSIKKTSMMRTLLVRAPGSLFTSKEPRSKLPLTQRLEEGCLLPTMTTLLLVSRANRAMALKAPTWERTSSLPNPTWSTCFTTDLATTKQILMGTVFLKSPTPSMIPTMEEPMPLRCSRSRTIQE